MKNRLAAAAAALALLAAGPALADDEAAVRAALDAFVAGVNACDIEAAIALGHKDETGFYPTRPALVFEREMDDLSAGFCEAGGRYDWTPHVDQLVVHGDVALVIGTSDLKATRPTGETFAFHDQMTLVWFRVDGEWLSRHAHFSTPLAARTDGDSE